MKRILTALLAVTTMAGLAIPAFAIPATSPDSPLDVGISFSPGLRAYDADGNDITGSDAQVDQSGGQLTIDPMVPGTTAYIPLSGYNNQRVTFSFDGSTGDRNYNISDFGDSSLWRVSLSKDTGRGLVKSITVENDKNLGGDAKDYGRGTWLKIVLNDSTMTSEEKFQGTVTLKARKDTTDTSTNGYSKANGNDPTVMSGDTLSFDVTLWVNNPGVSRSDGTIDTGSNAYFDPTANETNSLIWGDDRAALKFDASDDPGKFYAQLSTKSMNSIYVEYGDPAGADLWFYDFVGHPSIPSTSRATLTLGIPWDTSADYVPMPEDCYIYELDADGTLTDVTSQFTYSEDLADIAGWSTRTRVLGTYIVSDMELDLSSGTSDNGSHDQGSSNAGQDNTSDNGSNTPDKGIPNTGAVDMVNEATVASVVSLSAAGAIAFRKSCR